MSHSIFESTEHRENNKCGYIAENYFLYHFVDIMEFGLEESNT